MIRLFVAFALIQLASSQCRNCGQQMRFNSYPIMVQSNQFRSYPSSSLFGQDPSVFGYVVGKSIGERIAQVYGSAMQSITTPARSSPSTHPPEDLPTVQEAFNTFTPDPSSYGGMTKSNPSSFSGMTQAYPANSNYVGYYGGYPGMLPPSSNQHVDYTTCPYCPRNKRNQNKKLDKKKKLKKI